MQLKLEEIREQTIHVAVAIPMVSDIRCDDQNRVDFNFIYIWCRENATGTWARVGADNYYFEDEADAMAFKLRWG